MRIKALKRKVSEIVVIFLSAYFIFAIAGICFNYKTAYGENFSSTQIYSVSQSETINYTSKIEETYSTINNVPKYIQLASLANSCGATAGTIIIGFYDKYYEELIPNYVTYRDSNGKYKSCDTVYIPALMQELYTLMRTNVDAAGVSMSDCMSGLKQYVSGKSRTFGYSTVKTTGGISESLYLTAIKANKPIILFNSSTTLYKINKASDQDTLNISEVSDNHIYVGYGYLKIKYYNSTGNFRTDTYLEVATGLASLSSGYIMISSTATTVSNDWSIYGYSVSIS